MNVLNTVWRFVGTIKDSMLHNWMPVRRVFMPGLPIAVTTDIQHAPVGFDLTFVKELGKCEVKAIGIMGDQGFGKTFTASLMLLTGLAQDVGEGPNTARAYYPNTKHNNDRPETAPIVEDWLKCKVISPYRVSINPFAKALDLTYEEQFSLAIKMFQFIRKDKLSLEERKVLSETLKTMHETSDDPSFSTMHGMFESYKFEPEPDDQSPANKYRFKNSYYQAAHSLQLTIDMLQSGIYNRLFAGDSTEVVKLLGARIVSIDFKGVSAEVRSLIEIVLSAIHVSAIMPYPDLPEDHPMYNKPKHPERLPHFIMTDEAYGAWANPEFAEAEHERLKTQRAHGITTITLIHRLADLRESIGSSNQHQMDLALNATREIKVWLVGRQHRSALPDIREFLELPEYVIQSLTSLPKGTFWVITPWNDAPFQIAVIGTQREIATLNTDAAHHKQMQKYRRTKNPNDYMAYLRETTPVQADSEESEKD